MISIVYFIQKKKKETTKKKKKTTSQYSIINLTFGSNFGDEIDGRRLQKAFATSYTLTVNL